jgi:hypothetical protein
VKFVFGHLRTLNISAVCIGVGAIALGHALQINNGFYDEYALKWLTLALVVTVAGMMWSRWSAPGDTTTRAILIVVLLTGVAWQIHHLLEMKPGVYIERTVRLGTFNNLVALQAFFIALGIVPLRWIQRIWFPAVLAVSVALGIWMIRASPNPYIDVVEVHQEALNALLQDKDPYRITFENVYEQHDAVNFYNPDAIIGGRLAFAYPYPPPSLLLAVPGYVIAGDYRYSELLWLIVAAGLIGYAHRSLAAKFAACVLLTTPRVWFVIEQGWTEPIAVFAMALTTFLIVRQPAASGFAAGLMAVTKQYLGFSGLAVLRLLWMRPKHWHWIAGGMLLAAAAMILPFALWHPHAFLRNVVFLQAKEPFRIDSLSYLSWAAREGWGEGSFLWAAGAGAITAVLSFLTTRNTAAGFGVSVAATTFAIFAFGSKAFCNYYFFVIGALCATAAAYAAETNDGPAGDPV